MQAHAKLVWVMTLTFVSMLACAAPPPSSTRSTSGEAPLPGGSGAPKVMTWAVQQEPPNVLGLIGLAGTRGPSSAFRQIAHAQLVKEDHRLSPFPELAQELPSPDRGTWTINSDGTMQTTWKLRPGVKWHDGAPFTSDDVLFWIQLLKDETMPTSALIGLDQITSVTAPDALTLVINWSRPHYRANQIPEFGPAPRHILESVYALRDPDALLSHRYFSTEYVGLGPYRLAAWVPGAQIEFVRFDDYFGGRPPLDRVILRIIPDANTMVANALAGTVDVANPPAENMDAALQLSGRWEGTGNRVRTDSNDKSRAIYPQYRAEYAKPHDGAANRVVRQALYMALDRAAMAQVITEGLSPTADSWIAPSSPLRPSLESAIPQFPFDLAQAQRLLTQVGWVRGTDGILVHQATGERFELDVRNRPGSATERELVVAADFWKALGIAPSVSPGTPALVSDRFWVSTYPGVQVSRLDAEDAFNTRRTHTRAISNLENRWSGRNTGAYSNPAADAIQDRLVISIDPQEKITLHRQLLQEMMGDIALMPLYWDVELVLATRAVKGDVTAVETGWNVFSWDRE